MMMSLLERSAAGVKLGLLVASPQLMDPFFSRTVILLCEFNHEGAMGFVINRPMGIPLESVLDRLKLARHVPMPQPVLWGGPVLPEAGFLIFRSDARFKDEALLLAEEGVMLSSSRAMLEQAAQGLLADPYYLCLGYAGWGDGQLDSEIQKGTWIVLDYDPQILFDTPMSERWNKCMSSLGIAPEHVFMNLSVDE